jgi:hypothetical protein
MVPPDSRRMIPRRSGSTRSCAQTATDRELVESRESCWRMSHELEALRDTVAVLRAGANSLALDNATLKIENEHLRVCARTVSSKLADR